MQDMLVAIGRGLVLIYGFWDKKSVQHVSPLNIINHWPLLPTRSEKRKKSKWDTLVDLSKVTVVGLIDLNQSVALSVIPLSKI